MRLENEKARDRSMYESQKPQGCPSIIQGRKQKQFTKWPIMSRKDTLMGN